VTNKDSFENIANWLDEARINGNPEMVLCLVANKCDLEDQ
jgi:Ras-related protein Rab-2A